MKTSKYVVMSGYFHAIAGQQHVRSEHRTLSAAERAVARHGRDCTCGGVHVRVRVGDDLQDVVHTDRDTQERYVYVRTSDAEGMRRVTVLD